MPELWCKFGGCLTASGKTLCLWENPLPLSILSEHERQ